MNRLWGEEIVNLEGYTGGYFLRLGGRDRKHVSRDVLHYKVQQWKGLYVVSIFVVVKEN